MRRTRRDILLGIGCVSLGSCTAPFTEKGYETNANQSAHIDQPIKIELFDDRLHDVVDITQEAEMLSMGYQWIEGPAWDKTRGRLYFTDVPQNKAYIWTQDEGVSVFLDPSGIETTKAKGFREPGANGLLLNNDGKLIICNHGKRSVEIMDLDTLDRETLTQNFDGKRFNSPNDVIGAKDGSLYFTDPPYGLEGLNASPLKDMLVNGVYKLSKNGSVDRILDDMTFPNGIALSPDENWLYISQSDPKAPYIRRINLMDQTQDSIWFNAESYMKDGAGLPDGMAVSQEGYLFATGPMGVFIIHPSGDVLGRLNTGRACANCTFGESGSTLFITAQDRLLKIKTRHKGLYSL